VRSTARRLVAVAAGLAVAGILAGCGLAEDGARPGVAAEVGDTTISLEDVDEAAQELCDLRAEDPLTMGTPVSGAEVRTRALQNLVLRTIADGLAEQYDITPSPTYERIEAQAEEAGTVQTAEVVGLNYFVNVMQAVGAEEAGASASEEDQLAAGIKAAQEWTAREGIRTNPVFPEIAIGDLAVELDRDDDLAVAVSDFAEQALADVDRLEEQAGDSTYAESLPESQRCG